MLFTGTLRFNLTPFGEHSDAECWAALRRAHLAAAAEASPLGLDLVLREGGRPSAPARSSWSPSRARCCATPRRAGGGSPAWGVSYDLMIRASGLIHLVARRAGM